MPTWRMEDGECRDSLAIEVAAQCKLPAGIVSRASHFYQARVCLQGVQLLVEPSLAQSQPPAIASQLSSCWLTKGTMACSLRVISNMFPVPHEPMMHEFTIIHQILIWVPLSPG